MDQRLLNKLNKRIEEGTLRSLSHFEGYIDFFSNDYLGLGRISNDEVSFSSASTGSRLISGTSSHSLKVESEIASFFDSDSALFFNSGYDANVGLFSCIPQRGDTVIYDELIHASVRDGIRLSFANHYSFEHNSIEDLKKKIKEAKGSVYVAIEALYSMDGDIASLRGISNVCEEHNAYLIVDEAHSSGVFGENGKGLVAALSMENRIFARIVTFGKAYGSHGAVVLGSNNLTDYLVNFSRSFIYTTALPDSTFERNNQMVRRGDIDGRRNALQENLAYFRDNYKHKGLISEVNSPIQILQIGEVVEASQIAKELLDNHIAIKPIFSPTVAVGKERLRLCFHSFNSKEEIDSLIDLLPS